MDVVGLIYKADEAVSSANTFTEIERTDVLAACKRLQRALESPVEATIRIMLGVIDSVALKLSVDMGIFDAAATTPDAVTLAQLVERTGAESLLITRMMRMLVGMGIFKELGKDIFEPTKLSNAYVTGSPYKAFVIHAGTQNVVAAMLPDYFDKTGYQSPADAFNGPFQFARNTKLHAFDWLTTQPKAQHAFNTVMSVSRMDKNNEWFVKYPIEEKLRLPDGHRDAVILVDVGGGLGHELVALKEAFPQLTGKMIVQDLAAVVADAKKLPAGIEAQVHNFFDPQPIKGAKAYYLRTVLHDWPDKQARQILLHIRDAMTKDSILLINETALPETNVSLFAAQTDIIMMSCYSALDRTQAQFKQLLESAGFKLTSLWELQARAGNTWTLFEAVRTFE